MKLRKLNFVTFSFFMFFLLLVASWSSIFITEDARISELVSMDNFNHAKDFLKGLAGADEEVPAFMDKTSWLNAIQLTVETLMMSVMAVGFATIAMLFTVIPGARNVADGTLTLTKKNLGPLPFWFIRAGYVFSRAIPELVWAMMIIFIFKPGILPGAIALALHNFGILGKLCAEVIEDLDARPIRNLALCGAGRLQILLYGIIPTVLPKFLTYILYRWEVIMRTTIVVGFVGAGGLGQQFKLSMSFFHYTDLTLLLLCYLILVFTADFFSEKARSFIK